MLFTIVFFFIGPIVVLFILGMVSLYLTFSDYFSAHRNIGWAFLGVSIGFFLAVAASRASMDDSVVTLAFIVFLGFLASMQIPLAVELISEAVIPDPSKGLKVVSDHSHAESTFTKGNLDRAIQEYEEAIAKDSHDVAARFRLSELYYEKRAYHAAAAGYERVLASPKKLRKEQYCTALTRLAEIYSRHLGDIETARRHLQTITEKYPDTKYAEYAREYLDNL